MTISTKTIIDKIEILENCQLQVRQAEIVLNDNVEISRSFLRWVCNPGQDISNQDKKIQDIANLLWTTDVVNSFQENSKNIMV